ncbi:MAG: acylphosphatase [Gemmatimonadota bacterium]
MGALFLVEGQVQGVGYRWFVARHSRRLGLHGHARNLPDGTVEVVVAGPETGIEELLGLLRTGPAFAQVTRVERQDILDEEVKYKYFEIM